MRMSLAAWSYQAVNEGFRVSAAHDQPYPVINTLSDAGYPRGALNYWKSAFLTELSDTTQQIMTDAMHRCPSPMSGLGIVPYMGAVARVDATATAFAHRAPGYSLLIVSQWTEPKDTEQNIAWAKKTFDALRPHMTDRSYVNNLVAEDGRKVHGLGRQRPKTRRSQTALRPRQILPPQSQHQPIDLRACR